MKTPPLNEAEKAKLATCTAEIQAGLETFERVGLALLTIRNEQLYRDTHSSFVFYVEDSFRISKARAYQLMESAKVVDQMRSLQLVDVSSVVTLPTTEAQCRELAKIEPERRVEVLKKAVESTGGKPNAAAIKNASAPEVTKTQDADWQKALGIKQGFNYEAAEKTAIDALREFANKHILAPGFSSAALGRIRDQLDKQSARVAIAQGEMEQAEKALNQKAA